MCVSFAKALHFFSTSAIPSTSAKVSSIDNWRVCISHRYCVRYLYIHLTLPDERPSKLSKGVVAINNGLRALLYFKRYLDSRIDFCMFAALSLMAYIGSDRVCRLSCSIMLSKRNAIVEPRCLSGKCLKYHIEICAIELIWFESKQTRMSTKGNLMKGVQLCITHSLSRKESVRQMKEWEALEVQRSVVNAMDIRSALTARRIAATSFLTLSDFPVAIRLRVVGCLTFTRLLSVVTHF